MEIELNCMSYSLVNVLFISALTKNLKYNDKYYENLFKENA